MTRIVFPQRDLPPGKVRSPKTVTEWGRLHQYCWGCGTNYRVENHHIVGGSGRSDEPCNLFRACAYECHPRCEGQTVNGKRPFLFGEVLLMKYIRDAANFDIDRLEQLLGRKLDVKELFKA